MPWTQKRRLTERDATSSGFSPERLCAALRSGGRGSTRPTLPSAGWRPGKSICAAQSCQRSRSTSSDGSRSAEILSGCPRKRGCSRPTRELASERPSIARSPWRATTSIALPSRSEDRPPFRRTTSCCGKRRPASVISYGAGRTTAARWNHLPATASGASLAAC